MKTFNGYKKRNLNNTNVLLADGSTTTISNILDPLKNYLPLTGGTITASTTLPLAIGGGTSGYRHNIQLLPSSSWSGILFCGSDKTTAGDGTSAKSYWVGNNDGAFSIAKNGSGNAAVSLYCNGTTWYANLLAIVLNNDSRLSDARAANGGTSSYTNYLNVVATNEIRINRNGSSYYGTNGTYNDLYINYSWSEGLIRSINNYMFMDGGASWAGIRARGFYNSSGTSVSYEGHTHSYLPLSGGTLSGNLTLGNRVSLSSQSSVTRLTLTPYYHTGGPWYLQSLDDASNAYIRWLYGGTEVWKLRHDGYLYVTKTIQGNISGSSGSCTGNAATATTATNISGGYVNVRANSYYGSGYGIQMNNSDIIGCNSIRMGDLSDDWSEGLCFYRNDGNWDSFWALNGTAYFTQAGTNRTIIHSGNIGSLSVNYATTAGSAPANGGTSTATNRINIHDIRNATRNTSYFDAQRATLWFNNTGTPDGNWYSGIHMKGWTNGYLSWELCSGSTTSLNGNLYYRNGINDSWLGWKTIAFTDSNITGTAAGITGKTLVTASSVCTTNWSTYASNHIPTMSFMAYWNGAYSGTSSNLTYCANGTIIGTSNYTSYCATANHNHTYNVNDGWLRYSSDSSYVKLYGNSRQMVFRTDGTTLYSDLGGYPFCFTYGGEGSGKRVMLISTGGDIWGSGIGWVSTIKSTADAAHVRNAKITRGGGSYNWYAVLLYNSSNANPAWHDASCAIININTYTGWLPWIRAVDSENGSWTLGLYTNELHIGRIPKTNTGNSLTYHWTFGSTGSFTITGSFYANSDIRYKNIVEYTEPSVVDLATLPIFNYTWINRDDNLLRTGTSAQSVEPILPNLVTEDESGFKSLDYATLGAVAGITACKELVKCKAEIEELKDKINKLLAALSNKADKLRRMGPSYLR